METTSFFINIGISFLGLAFILWLNAIKAGRGNFSFQTWVNENMWVGTMTLIGILLASSLNMAAPETLDIFKTLTGVDLANTLAGWFSFSILLYEGIRKASKSKSKPINP